MDLCHPNVHDREHADERRRAPGHSLGRDLPRTVTQEGVQRVVWRSSATVSTDGERSTTYQVEHGKRAESESSSRRQNTNAIKRTTQGAIVEQGWGEGGRMTKSKWPAVVDEFPRQRGPLAAENVAAPVPAPRIHRAEESAGWPSRKLQGRLGPMVGLGGSFRAPRSRLS